MTETSSIYRRITRAVYGKKKDDDKSIRFIERFVRTLTRKNKIQKFLFLNLKSRKTIPSNMRVSKRA